MCTHTWDIYLYPFIHPFYNQIRINFHGKLSVIDLKNKEKCWLVTMLLKNLFQTLQQHDLAQIYLQYFKIVETNGYVHWTSLKVIQWWNVPEI